MLYVVTPDEACNRGVSISTKSYRHMAGTRRKQEDSVYNDAESVREKLMKLPSGRDNLWWQEFLDSLLPHLQSFLEGRKYRILRTALCRSKP